MLGFFPTHTFLHSQSASDCTYCSSVEKQSKQNSQGCQLQCCDCLLPSGLDLTSNCTGKLICRLFTADLTHLFVGLLRYYSCKQLNLKRQKWRGRKTIKVTFTTHNTLKKQCHMHFFSTLLLLLLVPLPMYVKKGRTQGWMLVGGRKGRAFTAHDQPPLFSSFLSFVLSLSSLKCWDHMTGFFKTSFQWKKRHGVVEVQCRCAPVQSLPRQAH